MIAAQPLGALKLETSKEDEYHSHIEQLASGKRGRKKLNPMDQLKEEIKDDVRFRELHDDIVRTQDQESAEHANNQFIEPKQK